MDAAHPPLQITVTPNNAQRPAATGFWQDSDGPSFKDVLDTLNPLQHIPVISTLYQSLTDDKPSTGANIIGGTLFGGAFGLLGSIVNAIVQNETGNDIGGNLMATLTGESPSPTNAVTPPETSTPTEHYLTASQRSAYNAYVSVQNA